MLGETVSAEPGPYRLARTPYARGILDALGSGYTEIVLQAPAQSAKSEIARNWIGWACDLDPGPIMIVFPTEVSAAENMEERVMPMFRDSPRLTRLRSARAWDFKRGRLALTTCSIFIGWAGSPQALAARPVRRVLVDEINKYPPYKGTEADALSLARARTQSYGRRGQVFAISTPTIPTGPITVAYESCVDRRTFRVPCPGCGDRISPDWDQVQWPGRDSTDDGELRQQRAELEAGLTLAYYVCPSCSREIQDSERWGIAQRGEWVSEGFQPGHHPISLSVGFQVSGLVTPWTSFSAMALKFVTAKLKGISELQHFYNSDLGVPFMGVTHDALRLAEVKPETLFAKVSEGKRSGGRGVVPLWAAYLIATVDPGKTGAHYTVRAWGRGYRSRLLAAGEAESLRELEDLVLARRFRREDGGTMCVLRLMTDVGGGKGASSMTRTDEIYRWAKTHPAQIRPLKGYGGAGHPLQPVVTRMHTYRPPGTQSRPYDVTLSVVDVEYFKDLTAGRIESEDGELWEIGCDVPSDYVMQVSAERKTLLERRVKATGEVVEVFRWGPRVVGAANHYFDCEVYQSVGAYMIDMDNARPSAPTEEEDRQKPRYEPKQPDKPDKPDKNQGRSNSRWRIGR